MKFLRKYPRVEDDAELTGELVRGFCAFGGAPENVWQGMGDDREDVEETRSSALEVSPAGPITALILPACYCLLGKALSLSTGDTASRARNLHWPSDLLAFFAKLPYLRLVHIREDSISETAIPFIATPSTGAKTGHLG